MKLLFSLLVLSLSSLQAQSDQTPFYTDPRGVVMEVADAVTGSFGLVEEDLTLKGAEPYHLTRTYRDGWHLLPHTLLVLRNQDGSMRADTFLPNGTPISFTAGTVSHLPAGYVNSQTTLSASTNAYNCKFENNKVTAEDGSVRIYAPSAVTEVGPFSETSLFSETSQTNERLQFLLLQKEILPNGNERLYTYNDAGKLVKIVLQNSGGKREFGFIAFSYSKNRMVTTCSNEAFVIYTFEFGKLLSVERSQKPDVSYKYENDRLVERILPEGQKLRVAYTPDGKVHSLFDAVSEEPLYTFEYAPQQTTVWDILGNKRVFRSRSSRLAVIEEYEKENHTRSTALFWGKRERPECLMGYAISDRDGVYHQAARFSYDQAGGVVSEELFTMGSIEFDHEILPVRGQVTCKTQYGFNNDSFHTLAYQIQPNGDHIRLDYKPGTNLLTQVVMKPVSGDIIRAIYTYNSDAELIKEVIDKNGKGQITETTVTPQSKLTSVRWFETTPLKEVLLRRVKYGYDKKQNLAFEESYDRNGMLFDKKSYSYDAHDLCTHTRGQDDALLSRTVYNANDQVQRHFSLKENSKTSYFYDAANRVVKQKERFPELYEREQNFRYDALGNRVAIIDEYGNTTRQTFDAAGRLYSFTTAPVMSIGGEKVVYTRYVEQKHTNPFPPRFAAHTTFQETLPPLTSPYKDPACEYDARFRVSRRKRPVDEKTSIYECQKYDLYDQVTECWIEDQNGVQSHHQFFTYDNSSNLIETRTDEGVQETRSYENNRLVSIVDQAGNRTCFEYNDRCVNRLGQYVLEQSTIFPNGSTEKTQYDALKRVAEKRTYDSAGLLLKQSQFTYDAMDHVLAHDVSVIPSDLLKPAFVRKEQQYNEKQQLVASIEAANTSYAKKTLYSYRDDGLIQSIQYPDGTIKSFVYNSRGDFERVLINGEVATDVRLDRAGRVCYAACKSGISTERSYSLSAKILSEKVSYENFSWQVGYEYDLLDRVTRILLPDSSSIQFIYKGLELDAVARVSAKGALLYRVTKETAQKFADCFFEKIEERDAAGHPIVIDRNGESIHRSFDACGRISRERSPRNIAYVYDSSDNMLKCGGRKFSYNILNQLEQENGASYHYDKNGHLASISTVHSEQKFSYDQDGHLMQYEKGDESVTFLTDFFGRRIVRKEKDETIYYLYIGQTEIGSFDKTGALLDLKVPSELISYNAMGAAAVEIGNAAYYALSDCDGNVACLVDVETGQKKESYSYTAFGEESIFQADGARADDTVVGNPWRFQASRKDRIYGSEWTGLDLMDR